mmetsp:Transcript_36939/g.59766  ORF Transcript_36939/g.59766 Transcript_36939/m.59766 type:complete len:208 (+) Transcript_36939:469-1092(+)
MLEDQYVQWLQVLRLAFKKCTHRIIKVKPLRPILLHFFLSDIILGPHRVVRSLSIVRFIELLFVLSFPSQLLPLLLLALFFFLLFLLMACLGCLPAQLCHYVISSLLCSSFSSLASAIRVTCHLMAACVSPLALIPPRPPYCSVVVCFHILLVFALWNSLLSALYDPSIRGILHILLSLCQKQLSGRRRVIILWAILFYDLIGLFTL